VPSPADVVVCRHRGKRPRNSVATLGLIDPKRYTTLCTSIRPNEIRRLQSWSGSNYEAYRTIFSYIETKTRWKSYGLREAGLISAIRANEHWASHRSVLSKSDYYTSRYLAIRGLVLSLTEGNAQPCTPDDLREFTDTKEMRRANGLPQP
jgi:hypothetical protein